MFGLAGEEKEPIATGVTGAAVGGDKAKEVTVVGFRGNSMLFGRQRGEAFVNKDPRARDANAGSKARGHHTNHMSNPPCSGHEFSVIYINYILI